MTEEREAREEGAAPGAGGRDRRGRNKPLTKIILRRLPPTMTEEQFLEQVSPIPEHDYIYFTRPDPSLNHCGFSRAYINFTNVDDIYLFKDKFDGYIFLDGKGVEYVGIVEYSPFQRIPKKRRKKDPKCGTIESDPVYLEFLESLKEPENENREPKLEYSYQVNDAQDKKSTTTPLLEYLAARKQDKRGREERRRRERETDKRKMRVDRKTKEGSIKNSLDLSDHDAHSNGKSFERNTTWLGEKKTFHRSKVIHDGNKIESKNASENEMDGSNWESHFPALSTRAHNAFTLTSHGELGCDGKESSEMTLRSGGDTCYEEEESPEAEVKKIKARDWEKDKLSKKSFEDVEGKDSKSNFVKSGVKSYREQRKHAEDQRKKSDDDKKDIRSKDSNYDNDKIFRKDRREKQRESPREFKSKETSKYSDLRKDRTKFNNKKDNPPETSAAKETEEKKAPKPLSHSDIKPFTQLPQVKTEDLTKVIEEMDRKLKLEEANDAKSVKESKMLVNTDTFDDKAAIVSSNRRNSFDSSAVVKDEPLLKRQNSLDDRSKSTDREDSVEKDKNGGSDPRTERRIRNKDRPSLQIYQPGMGKFSKQRIVKDKDTTTSKTDSEPDKKDT